MGSRRVVAASVATIVGSVWFGVGSPWPTHAQDVAPAFEVASVKPNKSGDGRISLFFQPGGRFNATGVTLKMLIGAAYGTPQPLMTADHWWPQLD